MKVNCQVGLLNLLVTRKATWTSCPEDRSMIIDDEYKNQFRTNTDVIYSACNVKQVTMSSVLLLYLNTLIIRML